MQRIQLITLFSLLCFVVSAQIGKVGINTTSPAAMLHVKDSSAVFTANSTLPVNPGLPPVSGSGARMMWYADKAAFRAGRAFGDGWDRSKTGRYSVALGYAPVASGDFSFAVGDFSLAQGPYSIALGLEAKAYEESSVAIGTSAIADSIGALALCIGCYSKGYCSTGFGFETNSIGNYATTLGIYTLASGQATTAMGFQTIASGAQSTSMGVYTSATGNTSTAIGRETWAKGYVTTTTGYGTQANGYSSTVVGHYNDTVIAAQTTLNSITSTTPLFIVGNGDSPGIRSNALTVLKNGRIGIGMSNPGFLLNFPTALGDKISLHGTTGNHYGFGIQPNLLQIHTDQTGSDIAFGYGSSGSFSEVMRIKGNGRVGIGTNNPQYKLDIADRIRLRTGAGGESAGIWFNKLDNTAPIAFIGMLNNEYIGVYGEGGAAWNLMMSTITGNVGIGLQNPTEKLHVTGNGKFTGSVFASCGTLACSDIRYKTKITSLSNSLQNILSLKGIYYYWDKEKFPEQQFNDARQIGFSAQEIEKMYPEMVHTDAEGYKSVDYSRMTPVLLEAIKEQHAQIETLNTKLSAQQSQIEWLMKEVMQLKASETVSEVKE